MEEFFSPEPPAPRPYRRLLVIATVVVVVAFTVFGIGAAFGIFGAGKIGRVSADRFPQSLLATAERAVGGLFESAPSADDVSIDLNRAAAPVHGTTDNFIPTGGANDGLATSSETSSSPNPANNPASGGSSGQQTKNGDKKTGTSKTPTVNVPFCNFQTPRTATRKVIFNEIAWMGTPPKSGQSAGAASADEWLELKNISGADIDLAGWQIVNRDGDFQIPFDASAPLPKGGFYLLERTDDDSVANVPADKIFTGALSNDGMWFKMFDASCDLVDEIDALTGWPGGDNATKRTLERTHDNIGWQTSAAPGGTPRAENSDPVIVGPAILGATTDETTTPDQNPITKFRLTVYLNGAGHGTVTSIPAGIDCGETCSADFPVGANILLKAIPDENSYLMSWSNPCPGKGDCGILLSGDTPISAQFDLNVNKVTPAAVPSPAETGGRVLIGEVQVGTDISSNDEFIELYNAGSAPVDLSGWSIKKKTSTGSEGSLLSAGWPTGFQGKSIQPGKYFLLVNQGGYAGSVGKDGDWATSNNLAYTSNSIAIYDASGTMVDGVSWSEIPKNKSYARISWSGSDFSVLDTPTPKNSTY